MIKPYECAQCGSTDFEDSGIKRVRCAHCGSLFEVLTDESTLTINKGARVIFGKNANVEILGDMEVQDGADVDIDGQLILKKGRQKKLFRLELITVNNNPKTDVN